MLVLVLFMCVCSLLIILLHCLTQLFKMDLCVLQIILLSWKVDELFDVQFDTLRNNILAQTSKIEM